MKKNWAMRAAFIMVALTLITSCFVGGTFAKYVTSGNGTDTARVAKFGVVVTATGDAFETTYAKTDSTFTVADDTVVSSNENKVVAPGTDHEVAIITITGTPEVAVRVTNEATVTLEGWTTDGSTEYCPIVFAVNGETYGTEDTNADNTYESVAALKAALEDAINAITVDFAANTDLSTEDGVVAAISWEWPFSISDDNDVKDTALGDNAAAGTAAVVSITLTTTVTQID